MLRKAQNPHRTSTTVRIHRKKILACDGDDIQRPLLDAEIQLQYPCKYKRAPEEWYIALAMGSISTKITTADDFTLKEAFDDRADEQEWWRLVIDDEFSSL